MRKKTDIIAFFRDSRSGRRGSLKTLAALDAGELDAVQKKGEIVGVDFQSVFPHRLCVAQSRRVRRRRHLEGSFFEPLVPKAKSARLEIKQLDSITPFGTKDEQITQQRIGPEVLAGHSRQRVEAAPHVGRQRAQEDARG